MALFVMALTEPLWSQELRPWHDPSPHRTQFVAVDENVKLEVLDWGGSGRPIVLLAGSGNTAHVFDDFAPKLTSSYHVYGVTRRGFGASDRPDTGYTDQRLADDVLHVMDSLKIANRVLVGHSAAGSELTTLGVQHSDRLAGLVYLDAGDDPGDFSGNDPTYRALFEKLPSMKLPPIADDDRKSFQAFRDMEMRHTRFAFPESELRNMFEPNADGSVGRLLGTPSVRKAMAEGTKKRDYIGIKVPVLAFFTVDTIENGWCQYYHFRPQNDEERAALNEIFKVDRTYLDRYEATMRRGVPNAQIIELPGADHYLYFTNEAKVLGDVRAFIARLL